MSHRMPASLITGAPTTAIWNRKPSVGLIVHSDQGGVSMPLIPAINCLMITNMLTRKETVRIIPHQKASFIR